MPKQSMSPRCLLRHHPNGNPTMLLMPQAMGNGRKQLPHARIPVAPARFCHRAPSAIARVLRHGGPAKIATQAMGNAPTRLPPTMQSSKTQLCTSPELHHSKILHPHGPPAAPVDSPHTGDDNELAPMASPSIQCHIQCDHQCQDGTQFTSSRASCEGDEVAMLPDGGDTSPPTELPAGGGLVTLQCADCCAPQTQLRPTLGCDSDDC
jgi:hypothetical protein